MALKNKNKLRAIWDWNENIEEKNNINGET